MVRSMLKGEKSDFDLETLYSKGYRQAPSENPPPIYLAGAAPEHDRDGRRGGRRGDLQPLAEGRAAQDD